MRATSRMTSHLHIVGSRAPSLQAQWEYGRCVLPQFCKAPATILCPLRRRQKWGAERRRKRFFLNRIDGGKFLKE